ncbi:nuclear receptor coactivator 5 [Anthonomus grandis grandis]|uniref:nuclear receptor coactivator 5 n=1 Tax=Anthonomus grandis grandis TaxID=2921223 RepID=UPI0021662159|nr:nuclear receptor coactivator 5 [Anthonomus grandis grandis]
MYRTDKQFMKNPATAAMRIYIGNIPKAVIADDLEAKFSKHGKILGLVINTGFAFIQYEKESEANEAINHENGANMMGRKIVVRQALSGASKEAIAHKGGPPGGPHRAHSQQETDQKIKFERPQVETPEEEMDPGPNIRPPQPIEDRGRRGGRGGNRGGRGGGRNRSIDRFEPPNDMRAMHQPFSERGGPGGYYDDFAPPQHIPAEVVPPSDRNDCEIIVVSRALTEYAEFIESRLKAMGLIVDLLFPNEDVPIGKVLANISSRGCLYAILVMPQNEEHRSLTLNVLHGIPQEHRNMPIDDALLLVQRNFEAYMRGEKAPEDPNKMTLADRHPAPIQMLFNLLAENRMLTTPQYDRLFKYLQERRDLQREHEISEGLTEDADDGSRDKSNELQNRILNILNKTNDPIIPTSITAPEPAPPEPSTPLLKDPSVQKALDSILSGDMFKNIAGGI